MKRAILFTNSSIEDDILNYIDSDDFIIGVDKGIDVIFQIGLKPDLLIGDFDSVSADNPLLKSEIPKITHPVEKDFTDTELAVDYAINNKYDEIVIINDMQGRFDHAFGVLSSLIKINESRSYGKILNNNEELIILSKESKIKIKKGQTISLVPLTSKVTNITTKGLYYPLCHETLFMNRARGISNIVENGEINIEYSTGLLLLIINH